MKLNENIEIINDDNISALKKMESDSINLIITSPPYDNLRKYNSLISEEIFFQLFRVLKNGGVLCWNVFDEKNTNGYSATSMKQVLKFIDVGFDIHQYLIYEKNSVSFNAKKTGKLYTNIFEFVFVLSKGIPENVNLICDKKNKYAGFGSYDGKVKCVSEYSPRTNIWKYTTSLNDKTNHPAVMPEKLARDLIYSYSNENDVVLDCYSGSGTTAKECHNLNRKFKGIEIDKKYFDESVKRLEKIIFQKRLF